MVGNRVRPKKRGINDQRKSSVKMRDFQREQPIAEEEYRELYESS